MSEVVELRKSRNMIEARKLLARWERSGKPFAAWCRQQGVSYQSLADYKRLDDLPVNRWVNVLPGLMPLVFTQAREQTPTGPSS